MLLIYTFSMHLNFSAEADVIHSLFLCYCLYKSAGTLRLLVVAVVGDNSTDTEEDARWTLGPRAPMGTDGWVGGTHTGSTGDSASTEGRKIRDHTTASDTTLHTSSLCVCVSRLLTPCIRTCGHLYAWLCISACRWMRAVSVPLYMYVVLVVDVSMLKSPAWNTECNKYILWFIFFVKHCRFFYNYISACIIVLTNQRWNILYLPVLIWSVS